MINRIRFVIVLAALSVVALWSRPAAAGLVLSFDQSTYTINGVGNTTAVQVFVSQTDGGPQVGVGNELISAAIELSYATGSTAAVLSAGDITAGPAWDIGVPVSSSNGGNTLWDLALNSLIGISDLSSPLLLGTFVFTGGAPGATGVIVASEAPGTSFVTIGQDVLDPTNTPGAQINVITAGSVPEPSGFILLGIAALSLGATSWRSRKTPRS